MPQWLRKIIQVFFRMKLKRLGFSGIAAVCWLLTSMAFLELFGSSSQPVKLNPPSQPVPASLFGLHIHRAFATTPWPSVPFGSWRLWDARVHWPQVELRRNEWKWDILDREVELAEKHHVDLLMPFGETPDWAAGPVGQTTGRFRSGAGFGTVLVGDVADLEDWRTYIRTQAIRYKGRIRYYEIWNEPNLPRHRVIGTPERMLTLAREAYLTLKEVDPDIQVVSPSPVNVNGVQWLERYLEVGGGKYADIIGYHFYVKTRPEDMLQLILSVKKVMQKYGVADKPLWNTESGWIRKLTDRIDPVQQAPGWAARAYILNWAAGVQRFYWYAWDDDGGDSVPFTEEDQATATDSAHAFAEVQKWLIGSRMEQCQSAANGNWVCTLTRESGRPAWILWSEDHSSQFDVPKAWGIRTFTKLSGTQSAWSGNSIDIGELPIMLEGDSARH